MSKDNKEDNSSPLYIRKSMIETYLWCPYQYKLIYLDGQVISPTYAMILGTRFHDFVEDYFNLTSPSTISLDNYTDHEKELYEYFLYYESTRKGKSPYAREIKLKSDRLLISGTIDRIDEEEDNTYTIVEYKTGKKIDDSSIMRQCTLYKMLIEEELPIKISRYRAINPRIKEVREYPPSERMEKKIKEIIEEIRTCSSFPRKCSSFKYPYCKMCDLDEVIEQW